MARKKLFQPTPKMNQLLKTSGSFNREESLNAMHEIAKALQLPLREGILSGDILSGIFQTIPLVDNATPEFPLHFLSPGTEKNFVAYTIPNHGYIPHKNVEGDYVMLPMYEIGNSIDWNLKYARDARWDVVGAATEVFINGFVKKLNDDGWHTLITGAADRNLVVLDSDAVAGQFTKRVVSLAKLIMRRNGGGNSTSNNRGKLTDLYVSPEATDDVRNWNVDEVDEMTRREIMLSENDNAINRLFGVNLHDLDELGEGQEYELFYENELGGVLPGSKVEIGIGLDLSKSDAFVMPVRGQLEMFEDDSQHRSRKAGLYGWQEQGFGLLDNRRVMLIAL